MFLDPVRLIIQREQDTGIRAINLDTHEQLSLQANGIKARQFHRDLIGFDDTSMQRYTDGFSISVGMLAEHWASWLQQSQSRPNRHVWLTVEHEAGWSVECFNALCLTSQKEIVCPDDRAAFIRDALGWNEASFQQGCAHVVRMSKERWAVWLEMWEPLNLGDVSVESEKAIARH